MLRARSLLQDPMAVFRGLSRKDTIGSRTLSTHPRPASQGAGPRAPPTQQAGRAGRRPVYLVTQNATQTKMCATDWLNIACQIKLGTSKLKIHIYFNWLGCSRKDERKGR